MALDLAGDLPTVDILPLADTRFLRAARDIALLASGLMQSQGSPLLALAVPSDAWDGTMPVQLWTDELAPCPSRTRAAGNDLYAPALDALCLASDALFARLRIWGWKGARRSPLCIVTDGVGVALVTSARRIDRDWLFRTIGPRGGATGVLPPAADGVWALLALEPGDRSLH